MKGQRKLKSYIEWKFPDDEVWYERDGKRMIIKSNLFICHEVCDLWEFCKVHGMWFWIEQWSDDGLKIVIVRQQDGQTALFDLSQDIL